MTFVIGAFPSGSSPPPRQSHFQRCQSSLPAAGPRGVGHTLAQFAFSRATCQIGRSFRRSVLRGGRFWLD
jgi:hypothetical protein